MATDIWASVVINLMIIILAAGMLIQIGYFLRWIIQFPSSTRDTYSRHQPVRSNRMEYTSWHLLRVIFNYFLLPVISFTSFQVVRATLFPIYHTSIAVLLVAFLGLSMALLLRYLSSRRLVGILLEDSNSYKWLQSQSVGARNFALITYCLTFVRGIAIGAFQFSALAQIAILTACELAVLISEIILRPYTSRVSSQTCVTVARLITILLSSAFLPGGSLVATGENWVEWVGYAILLMHVIVLVSCFLLPSLWQIAQLGLNKGFLRNREWWRRRSTIEQPQVRWHIYFSSLFLFFNTLYGIQSLEDTDGIRLDIWAT